MAVTSLQVTQRPKMGHDSKSGNCLFRIEQYIGFRLSPPRRMSEGRRISFPNVCDDFCI
jgi:hypothetical protein